jgi:hypothetical protein
VTIVRVERATELGQHWYHWSCRAYTGSRVAPALGSLVRVSLYGVAYTGITGRVAPAPEVVSRLHWYHWYALGLHRKSQHWSTTLGVIVSLEFDLNYRQHPTGGVPRQRFDVAERHGTAGYS